MKVAPYSNRLSGQLRLLEASTAEREKTGYSASIIGTAAVLKC